ncbi:MAG: TauD/TfdA family dioxygenase [Rhodospirillales bacterium]|nr:TauD/TfdA family dioxygenase [Rhodospirillales bacterium]
MPLTVHRLSPALGAEVAGVDAGTADAATFDAIRKEWLASDGVLVLRNQSLTPEQHIAFSRRFGQLETHVLATYLLPGFPEIYRVSNKTEGGKPMGRARAGTYWHSDLSYMQKPAMVSLLYGIEIPPIGGDTMFCNMYAAYDALSPTMKTMIGGLRAVHDLAFAARGVFANERPAVERAPAAEHPVVRTHPETGRKALFVNPGFTSHIVGLAPAESAALLGLLFQHATQPEFIYRHRWLLHDLVMWDNRCTMHYAIADYEGIGERYMHRTTVLGDEAR